MLVLSLLEVSYTADIKFIRNLCYLIRIEKLFNLFSSGYRNLHLDIVFFSRKKEIFMVREIAVGIRFNLSLI